MPHTQRTFDGLAADLQTIRERLKPTSILYVGWRHDTKSWWYDVMCKELGVHTVGVLEIFPKNVGDLEQKVWEGRYDLEVIQGDIREVAPVMRSHMNEMVYDIIFWDHGPEHVGEDDLRKVTRSLQAGVEKLLIYCCPWGEWPQGVEDQNEYEIHRTTVTKEMLEGLGFQLVKTFGSPGVRGEGELLAYFWK